MGNTTGKESKRPWSYFRRKKSFQPGMQAIDVSSDPGQIGGPIGGPILDANIKNACFRLKQCTSDYHMLEPKLEENTYSEVSTKPSEILYATIDHTSPGNAPMINTNSTEYADIIPPRTVTSTSLQDNNYDYVLTD